MANLSVLLLLFQTFVLIQGAALLRENSWGEWFGVGIHRGVRVKKQTNDEREWTVSSWSECSVTCGGGLRTRSVRCLDEDGVISQDCDQSQTPPAWEFCNQIVCATLAPQPDLVPSSGDFNFINGDGSTTVLSFDNRGPTNYEIQQNTTEVDGTTFQSTTQVTPPGNVQTMSQIRSRSYNLAFLSGGEQTRLLRDGEPILILNGIQRYEVDNDQEVSYNDGIITVSNDGPTIQDSVNRFLFYDGFRFYEFNDDKNNSLPGPGTLYVDPLSSTALYSTVGDLNIRLDQVISSLLEIDPTVAPEVIPSTQALVTIEPISVTISTPTTSEASITTVLPTRPETSTLLPMTSELLSTEEITDAPDLSVTTPDPGEITPDPIETTPDPIETTPDPIKTTPDPIETTPDPDDTTPDPDDSTPDSTETKSESSDTVCVESTYTKTTRSKSSRTKTTRTKSGRSKSSTKRRKHTRSKKTKTSKKSQVMCNPVESTKTPKKTRKTSTKCTRSRHYHHHCHHHSKTRKTSTKCTRSKTHCHHDHTHGTRTKHTKCTKTKTHHHHCHHDDHTPHNHTHCTDHTHGTRTKHTKKHHHHCHHHDHTHGTRTKHTKSTKMCTRSKTHRRHCHHNHTHDHGDHTHGKTSTKCTRSKTHRHHHHCHHDHTHNHTHLRDQTVTRHTKTTKSTKRTHSTKTSRGKSSTRSKRQALLDMLDSINDDGSLEEMNKSVPLDLDSMTLNFELTLVDGRIFLSHNGQRFIDVTNPAKTDITDSMLIAFKDGTLTVTDEATGEIITSYENIEQLAIFNGTNVVQILELYGPDKASNGELYVSGHQAFYSNNKQFNELLEEQLKRVVPDRAQVMLVFQVLPSGDQLLLIGGSPVLQLNGAKVFDIPDRDFLQYANNTIFVQDFIEGMLDQFFPGITQLFVLNGISPGLEMYIEVVATEIPGGGRLYIHQPTGRAFYSRDDRINDAITEHINSLSQPPPSITFSIRFELGENEIPDVVVLANDEEIIQLIPGIVEDHSLAPTQHLVYRNGSVLILMGDVILGAVDDIDELVFFDGTQFIIYEGSAPEIIVGGGQIFVSGNQSFYSVNSELNDRIGEALKAVEELASPTTLPPTVITTVFPPATMSESKPSTNDPTTVPEETTLSTTHEVTSSKSRHTKPSTKAPSPEATVEPEQSTTKSPHITSPDQTTTRSPRTRPDQTTTRSPRTNRTLPRTKPPSSKPLTRHRGHKYKVRIEENPLCAKNKSCCNGRKSNKSSHHHHHHHHNGDVQPVVSSIDSTGTHSTRRSRRSKHTVRG